MTVVNAMVLLLIGIGLGAGALWLVGRLRRQRLAELEKRVAQKEESIDRKIEMFAQREAELGKRDDGLRQKEGALEGRRAEYERLVDAVRQKLEQTAGLTREEAKKTLAE